MSRAVDLLNQGWEILCYTTEAELNTTEQVKQGEMSETGPTQVVL